MFAFLASASAVTGLFLRQSSANSAREAEKLEQVPLRRAHDLERQLEKSVEEELVCVRGQVTPVDGVHTPHGQSSSVVYEEDDVYMLSHVLKKPQRQNENAPPPEHSLDTSSTFVETKVIADYPWVLQDKTGTLKIDVSFGKPPLQKLHPPIVEMLPYSELRRLSSKVRR